MYAYRHVMGLLHRGQKEYLQAIKAYKQALKIDPSNMLILRDNSLLQVQMRDYNGFVETRRKILMDKSNNKVSGVGVGVGLALC